MQKNFLKSQYLGISFIILSLALSGCGKKVVDNNLNSSVNEKKDNSQEEINKNIEDEERLESFTGKLEDLMKKGKSFKCTTIVDADDIKYDSVYYIDSAKERTRADMKMKMLANDNREEQEIFSHMIVDEEVSYTWKDGDKKGTKISLKEDSVNEIEENIPEEANLETGESLPEESMQNPLEEEMNFNCEKWEVDESIFEVPSDVEFEDLAEMMNKMNDLMAEDQIDMKELEKYMNETKENLPQ